MGKMSLQVALGACFAVIVALAIAAVDYSAQARRAGQSLASYGVSAYVGSIGERYLGMKAEQAASREKRALQALAERDLLPEAPDGWTRRDWTQADQAALDPQYDMQQDEFLPEQMKQDATLAGMAAAGMAAEFAKAARRSYVYEREGEIVALELSHTPVQPGGMTGMALAIVAGNMNAMSGSEPFAVVGGVAFQRPLGLFGGLEDPAAESEADPVTVLKGRMSDEATITLRARAGEDAMMALLLAIDYDRINSMLNTPVPTISNDAPVLDAAQAAAMIAAQDAEIQARGQKAEAQLQAIGEALSPDRDAEAEPPADQRAEAEGESSLASRLSGFFKGNGSGGATETAQAAAPKVFVCSFDQGFKRCSAQD